MLTARAQEWLEDRGFDPELLSKFGIESEPPSGVKDGRPWTMRGEWIVVPNRRDGAVIHKKFRNLDPEPGREPWLAAPGGERTFWNVDVLFDRTLDDEPLIITEGEWDALSMIQAGFVRTVSVPNGAPKKSQADRATFYNYLEDLTPQLDRVRLIILATDADGPGYTLLEDLTTILGPTRCKFVSYPDGCKDANDVLVRFGAERLRQCVRAARWVNVAGVRRLSDYPPGCDVDPVVWRTGISPAFDRHVGIMPGYISVWTGIPSHGKTTLLKQITWTLCGAAGALDPNNPPPSLMRAAVGSFEELFARDYKRDAMHYLIGRPRDGWNGKGGGGPWTREEIDRAAQWLDEHIVAIDPHGYVEAAGALEEFEPTMDWTLEALRAAIVRHQCQFNVVDPWGEIVQTRKFGQSEHDFIGESLSRFNRLARTLKAHIAIIAHPYKLDSNRKGEIRPPGPYDVSGSAYWFNKPSLGSTVHRDPAKDPETKEPIAGDTRTRVDVWKSKFEDVQGPPGTFHLYFNRRAKKFEAA